MGEQVPTTRELEILKVLWSKGEATVREIYAELKPIDGELAYTTILTMLQIMQRKGLVTAEKSGKAHIYRAAEAKKKTTASLTKGFLKQVFDGAVTEFVARAIESRRPSVKELEDLEKLIADAKRAAKKRSKPQGDDE